MMAHHGARRSLGGATASCAAATTSAMSSQSCSTSRYTPIQPRPPTYGGRKNLPASSAIQCSCAPSGAAAQNATRSSWCRSATVRNCFPTNQDGSPWLSRSVAPGWARHTARTRSTHSCVVGTSILETVRGHHHPGTERDALAVPRAVAGRPTSRRADPRRDLGWSGLFAVGERPWRTRVGRVRLEQRVHQPGSRAAYRSRLRFGVKGA